MDTDPFLNAHLPGSSEAMRKLRKDCIQLNLWHRQAPGRVRCVLVTGETGTGKGQLCRLLVLHDTWVREGDTVPTSAFIAQAATDLAVVLLTAVPDTLAESELFGHVRGAFTGADKNRKGVFGDDDIKNVMLDEIGDASLPLQGKLLQVIQDGSFRRVGDDPGTIHKTAARILVCTHQPLSQLVSEGRFREDLYWRLIPFRLYLPPLRERRGEILTLANRMIAEHLAGLDPMSLGLPENPALSDAEQLFTSQYDWPGNLRQLSDALLVWLINEGKASLEAIASQTADGSRMRVARPVLKTILKERIQEVLSGTRPAYPKVGALLKEFEREVKSALHELKDELPLSREELERLFPEQKVQDIRSMLSEYRKLSRSENP